MPMSIQLPDSGPCPFCEYLDGSAACVFVARGSEVSVMLNPRQYERGALLVIPNKHSASILSVDDAHFLAVQVEARRMARLLVDQLGATGVNVFQNAGIHAGQSIAHYHVHVVPRYPTSDPARRFREADYTITPQAGLEQLASLLQAEAGV